MGQSVNLIPTPGPGEADESDKASGKSVLFDWIRKDSQDENCSNLYTNVLR